MTEQQGGTDVRANTTRAERAGSGFYRITGHKWFMSAPMSDAFLILGQASEGLSCFLVPRILGDGTGNGFRYQRLKDKLGNRSNASAEVEFVNAIGQVVGEPGAGVKTIMDMVTLTRLDCAVASSGLMRAGLAEAIHHTRHRDGVRPETGRPAADAARAGRHGAGRRGRCGAVVPPGALLRRRGQQQDRGVVRPRHDAGGEILGLQDRAGAAQRGDGVPGRQRLCRGDAAGALLPRGAGQRDLGRLRQRDGARRAARAGARAGSCSTRCWRGSSAISARAGRARSAVLRAAMQVARSDEGSARILTEQLALSAAAAELKRMGAGRIADAFIESRLAGQWRDHLRHARRAP